MEAVRSDALVFFGATGTWRKNFPGAAGDAQAWEPERAGDRGGEGGLEARRPQEPRGQPAAARGLDPAAFDKLCGLLRYVDGDYNNPATFAALWELRGAEGRSLPGDPAGAVRHGRSEPGEVGVHRQGRVIVEKPFGRDLCRPKSSTGSCTRRSRGIDLPHRSLPGQTPVHNMMFFRFTNMYLQPFFDREHVESGAADHGGEFRRAGRGGFTTPRAGPRRDAEPPFQIIANLAMERRRGWTRNRCAMRRSRFSRRFQAIGPGRPGAGQFSGYLKEAGVAPGSTTETFSAMRFGSIRGWQGVPFYLGPEESAGDAPSL